MRFARNFCLYAIRTKFVRVGFTPVLKEGLESKSKMNCNAVKALKHAFYANMLILLNAGILCLTPEKDTYTIYIYRTIL